MRVKIVKYDPSWAESFQRIREELMAALVDVPVISIEHVGSTSVPGLAAKPIIDIDIIVDAEHLPAAASALSFGGYFFNPEPRGIDRMSFRYNMHTHDSGATRPTEDGDVRRAVYLNSPAASALRNHLAVKEVLLKHPELVEEYSKVKMELSTREYKDIGEYGGGKDQILQKIFAHAELDVVTLDAIAKFNKTPILTK